MTWFWIAGLRILCAIAGHPPITSIAWDEQVENTAEREANLIKMQGGYMTVNCACGRKMVDPIWRPWWRPSR